MTEYSCRAGVYGGESAFWGLCADGFVAIGVMEIIIKALAKVLIFLYSLSNFDFRRRLV
jgi:hypothetical protein